jgi:hypothetical protein
MPLNEFGDFFAGVFGPLMLFWLILGYIQQQKELKQNTKMLELQADELKKSVEQHKELVKTTREQLKTDREYLELEQQKSIREVQPELKIERSGWSSKIDGSIKYNFILINTGKAISSLKFNSEPEIKCINNKPVTQYLGEGDRAHLEWMWNIQQQEAQPPQVLILFAKGIDANKNIYEKTFILKLDNELRYIEKIS